ncbi:hypothetical protein [Candidatus Epulonipiscium viviparus]|uniref:hypothetical protein n=1 Tax=Candidatus Epulonipiscium viviparus TaxID=420336 RepID=UPI0027381667|nr:hypothetical protein [Candidatus Epulopiscium viviparus]
MALIKKHKYLALMIMLATTAFPVITSAADLGDDYVGVGIAPLPAVDLSDDAEGATQDSDHSNNLVSLAEFNMFYALNEQLAASIRTLQANPSKIGGIEYGPDQLFTDAMGEDYLNLEKYLYEGYASATEGLLSQIEVAVLTLKDYNSKLQVVPMKPGTGVDYRDKVVELMDKIYAVNVHADAGAAAPPIKFKNILLDNGATKKVTVEQYDGYEVPTLQWEEEFQPSFYTVEVNMTNAAGNYISVEQGAPVTTSNITDPDKPVLIKYTITDNSTKQVNTFMVEVHVVAASVRSARAARVAPNSDNGIPIYLSKVEGADIAIDKYWVNESVHNKLYEELEKAAEAVKHIHPESYEALITLESTNPETGEMYTNHHEVAYGAPELQEDGGYTNMGELEAVLNSLSDAYNTYIAEAKLGTDEVSASNKVGNFEIMVTKALMGLKDIEGPFPSVLPNTSEFAGLIEDPDTIEAESKFYKSGAVYVYLDENNEVCLKADAVGMRIYKPPSYKQEAGLTVIDIAYDGRFEELDAGSFFVTPAIAESEQDLGEWQPGGDTETPFVTQMFINMEDVSEQIGLFQDEANAFYKLDGLDNEENKLGGSDYDEEVQGSITALLNVAIQAIIDRSAAFNAALKPGTRHEQLAMLLQLQKMLVHLGMGTVNASGAFVPYKDFDGTVGTADDDLKLQPAAMMKLPMGDPGVIAEDNLEFNIEDYEDSTLESMKTTQRDLFNVSSILGTNVSAAKQWVTMEEHDALYRVAVEALTVVATVEFKEPVGDMLPAFPYVKTEAGTDYIINPDLKTKIYTATQMSNLADELQNEITAYEQAAEAGITETLSTAMTTLRGQINSGEDILTIASRELVADTNPDDAIEFVTEYTPRSIAVANLVISDEGLYKITTEAMDPIPDAEVTPTIDESIAGIEQVKMAMDVTEANDTHWVTPETVDALDAVLTDAIEKSELVYLILPTNLVYDYENADGTNKPGIDELVRLFYDDNEVFNNLAIDLAGAIENFNDAKVESLAEEYKTGQDRLDAAIKGEGNPKTARSVVVGDEYKSIGKKDSDIYLAEDNADHPDNAPDDRTLVFSEDGYRYKRYIYDDREWTDLSLIPTNAGIKWVNSLDLQAYDKAIDKVEGILEGTMPRTYPTPDNDPDKFEDAIFSISFLPNFVLDPVGYFDQVITELDKATDDFNDTKKDPVRPTVDGFDEAYAAFIGGTTTYNEGVADIKAANVRLLKDANNNSTGQYTSTTIHISNDGLTGIDGALLNDDNIIDDAGKGRYVAKGNFEPLNQVLVAIDKFINKDIAEHTAEFGVNPQYFDIQMEYLQNAIAAFDAIRADEEVVLDAYIDDYKAAVDEIASKINEDLINAKILDVNADVDGIETLDDLINLVFDVEGKLADVQLDTTRVLISHDGLRPGAFDDGSTTATHWTIRVLFTNIADALEGIEQIVTDALAGNLNHVNGFIKANTPGVENTYFQTLPSVELLDVALENFEVVPADKSFELNEMLEDAIMSAKRIIGWKEEVDAEGNVIPEIVSPYLVSNQLGIEFLTFDILRNGDTDANGFDDVEISLMSEIEYIDASQIYVLEQAIRVGLLASTDSTKQQALDKLTVLIDEFEPRVLDYKTSSKVLLYNQICQMEAMLEDADGDRILVSDSYGENIPLDRMYVTNAVMTIMLNSIDYSYTIVDKIQSLTVDQVFSQVNANMSAIERFKPLPGEADEDEYAAFEEVREVLMEEINKAAALIAKKPITAEGVIDVNAAVDTANAAVISKVQGTDISGQDENEDNIPDAGGKWVYDVTFMSFDNSINVAIQAYNAANSTVDSLKYASTIMVRDREAFERSIEYGTKEIYTDLTQKMQEYVDNATLGTDAYMDNVIYEEVAPIPAFEGLAESIMGGIDIEATQLWATKIEKDKLRNIVNYAQNVLKNNANIADNLVTYSLKTVVNEYEKLKTAYELFYARDLDGKMIPGKVPKVNYGSKGFADSEIRKSIANAVAIINDLVYLQGAEAPVVTYTTYDGVPLNKYGYDRFDADGNPIPDGDEGNGNGIDEGGEKDIRVSNRKGIDVTVNDEWINAQDVVVLASAIHVVQSTLDKFDNGQTNKLAMDNAVLALEKEIGKFEDKVKVMTEDSVSEDYVENYNMLKQAIDEAMEFIGKDPETGLFDYGDRYMDWGAADVILQDVPLGMKAIRGSVGGRGDDVVYNEEVYWVPIGNYKAYEAAIAAAQKALLLYTSTEDSLEAALRSLQNSTNSMVDVAITQINGKPRHGRNEEFNLAVADLKAKLEEAKTLAEATLVSVDGSDIKDLDNWVPASYMNLIESRIKVSQQAIDNSYGNFLIDEATGEAVIDPETGFKISLGNDTTTLETIEIHLQNLTAAVSIFSENLNQGEIIGTDPKYDAAEAKAALKKSVDKAMDLGLTKVSLRQGTDVAEGITWVTHKPFLKDPRAEGYPDVSEVSKPVPPITYIKNAAYVANLMYLKTEVDEEGNKISIFAKEDYESAKTILEDQIKVFENVMKNDDNNIPPEEIHSKPIIILGTEGIGGEGSQEAVLDAKKLVDDKIFEVKARLSETTMVPNSVWEGAGEDSTAPEYGYAGDAEEAYKKRYIMDGRYYAHEKVYRDLNTAVNVAVTAMRRPDILAEELIGDGAVLDTLEDALEKFLDVDNGGRKLKGAYTAETSPVEKARVFINDLLSAETDDGTDYRTTIPNTVLVPGDEEATIEAICNYIKNLISVAVKEVDIMVTGEAPGYEAPGETTGPDVDEEKGAVGTFVGFEVAFADGTTIDANNNGDQLGVFVDSLDWENILAERVEEAVALVKANRAAYVLPARYDHDADMATAEIQITEEHSAELITAMIQDLLVDNGFTDFEVTVNTVPRTFSPATDGNYANPDGIQGRYTFTAILKHAPVVARRDVVREDNVGIYTIETAPIDAVIEPNVLPNEFDTAALIAAKDVIGRETYASIPAENNSEFGAKTKMSEQIATLLNRPETTGVTFEIVTTKFTAAKRPTNTAPAETGLYEFMINLFKGVQKDVVIDQQVGIAAPGLDLAQDDLDAVKSALENTEPPFDFELSVDNAKTSDDAKQAVKLKVEEYLTGTGGIDNAISTEVTVNTVMFDAADASENGRYKFRVTVNAVMGDDVQKSIVTNTIESEIASVAARVSAMLPEGMTLPEFETESQVDYYAEIEYFEEPEFEIPEIEILDVPSEEFYPDDEYIAIESFDEQEFDEQEFYLEEVYEYFEEIPFEEEMIFEEIPFEEEMIFE